jgi:CheY-like chemotaxis protein
LNAPVLVIEDDQDTCATIEQVLLADNITSQCVQTRDDALLLLDKGVRPSCILVDYMMPGTSLTEFIYILQALGLASARIVLTTASSDIEDVAKRLGIRYTLRKPIMPDDLIRVVKSAIESGEHAAVP